MTLEFHKLTQQVEQMGETLSYTEKELEDKALLARQLLSQYGDAEALLYVDERVQDALDRDAGYRGARPLDEPIAETYPGALPLEAATLVATDGSQIYPDPHGPALYYLLNMGTIILYHGSGQVPQVIGEPYLFYDPEYLISVDHALVSNAAVSARRAVVEMTTLATHTWTHREAARPLLALLDGPLLFFMGEDVPEREYLLRTYFDAMQRLQEAEAALVGYIDRPRSRFVVGLLHLLDLAPEDVSRRTLATDGRLEGVTDILVYRSLLAPGERSALFVQMSPANKAFKGKGGSALEICFFYMNVAGASEQPSLARVEIPRWAASDKTLVAQVQTLLYAQCQQLTSRYPYLLTRAHEVAVVRYEEQRQLEVMIRVALTRHEVEAIESDKQAGKAATRSDKTRHEI